MTRPTFAALLIAIAACSPTALAPTPSPAPSAVAIVTASPAPTPTPTNVPPSPTSAARFIDPLLGYAVTLPAGWRVSECMSGATTTRDAITIGYDTFTWRTSAEEQALGGGGDVGVSGAGAWAVGVYAEISALAPTEYAKSRGGSAGDVTQAMTIDGKPAARTADAVGSSVAYYIASAGRVYTITLQRSYEPRPAFVTDALFDSIARSITFVTPAARPTPTPAPTLGPAIETLADAVAAAFAASDADRLRELMRPTCWLQSGTYQGGGAAIGRDAFAASLRASFAKGQTVRVEPRPIIPDAPILRGAFWVWSTWSAYPSAAQSNVQLIFDQIDGRWYWTGALFNAPR